MTVREFSKKIFCFNQELNQILVSINKDAPLLNTSAMIVEHGHLEAEKQRNNLGLIRAIFLGESNSGKSTMINAFVGKIVVPEVAHTSTMIPTWIGYTDDFAKEGVEVDYYTFDVDDEGNESIDPRLQIKKESLDDFRCFYCFPPEAAADPERLYVPPRFRSMKLNEAYMRIYTKEGLMSRFSMSLVDTLGNGATLKDDLKAQHNMQDVDMAFVLLNENGTINQGTRDFLARTLFKSAIRPEHIVFVINKIDRAISKVASIRNCKESIAGILRVAYGENIPQGLKERLFEQIVPYSALYNRIVTAGSYPYTKDTLKINGMSEADYKNPKDDHQSEIAAIAEQQTKFESKLLSLYTTKEDFLKEGCYNELEKVLTSVVGNMFADGTIVKNHLDKIKKLVESVKICIEDRLEAFNQDLTQISDKISRFTAVEKELKEENNKFTKNAQTIINDFPRSINVFLKNHVEKIANAFIAKGDPIVQSVEISAEVRNKFSTAKQLKKLSEADIQQYFVPGYNVYKEKLVAVVCDEICDKIFRSVNEHEPAPTPYLTFNKKIQQSINNYITTYMDKVESINDGHKLKIVIVDGALFKKYADDKMNYLVLRLVEMIQKNTDKIINENLAEQLRKSIHTFSCTWHSWWNNNDVNFYYNKMNNAAKEAISRAVKEYVFGIIKSDDGFIKSSFGDRIKDNLKEIIDYTKSVMSDYLNCVNVELLQLENSRTEFLNRENFYKDFAKEKVSKPLSKMLKELKDVENTALNNEMEF